MVFDSKTAHPSSILAVFGAGFGRCLLRWISAVLDWHVRVLAILKSAIGTGSCSCVFMFFVNVHDRETARNSIIAKQHTANIFVELISIHFLGEG